jgi:sugar phosphate isomerase/epimerase
MATLEQVAQVLSAFGYDGIELGGFFDHATVERFPDKASRGKLKDRLDGLGLEVAGIAPGPYGDLFRLPWATGSQEVYDEYLEYFDGYLRLAADLEIPGMPTTTRSGIASSAPSSTTPRRVPRWAARCSGSSSRCSPSTSRRRR